MCMNAHDCAERMRKCKIQDSQFPHLSIFLNLTEVRLTFSSEVSVDIFKALRTPNELVGAKAAAGAAKARVARESFMLISFNFTKKNMRKEVKRCFRLHRKEIFTERRVTTYVFQSARRRVRNFDL